MSTLVFDIETDGLLRQDRDAKTGAIKPEMSRMWLLIVGDPANGEVAAYSDVDPDLPSVDEGYQRLLSADRYVGHNVLNFDIPAMERLGMPLDPTKALDTMVLSRLQEPSKRGGHALDRWGLDLGYAKGNFKDFGRYSKEMLEYAIRDVELNIKVWEKVKYLIDFCPDAVRVEHVFAWCMSLQMRNGFALDLAKSVELLGIFEQEKDDLERGLQDVFPPRWVDAGVETPKRTLNYKDPTKASRVEGAPFTRIAYEVFNPGSRPQIASRLVAKGWKPKKMTETGIPKVDEKTLADVKFPEAQAIVEYLTAQKKLSQVVSWLEAERDGRIYGYINTIGANTHRCTHNNPNVAQVTKKDLRMREVWLASPGMSLVGVDAEGLELRMMGHYLARWDGGAFSRSVIEGRKEDGTDAHSINQKAAGLYLRDSAKTLIYALIYGAGDGKLGQVVIDDARAAGKPKPKGNAFKIGKAVRAKLMAGIPGLEKLIKAISKRVDQGFLIGLDGRKVHIRSAHSALNALLQSAGAIVMKWAVLDFWEREQAAYENGTFRFCANVHDEQQLEVIQDLNFPEEIGQSFARAITNAGTRLGVRCPLAGSYDIGNNWAETH